MMSKRLVAGLLMAVSLHAFDELVLIISLPAIVESLGGEKWYGLCLASYMLSALVAVAWAGSWIDQHGPSGIFKIGVASFFVGLILGFSAQSMWMLIGARILQGIGGGIVWTVAYSVINRLAAAELKSKMVAMLDSSWLLPSLLAPLIGGLLVDYVSWRWIFLMQVPFVVVIFVLVVPRFQGLDYENQPRDYSSLKGALRIGLVSLLLLWVVSEPFGVLWVALPLLILAMWKPLNDVFPNGWLTLNNPLAVSVVLLGCSFFAFFGVETFLPLFLIHERGFTTSQAGVLVTCGAFSWVAASFSQTWLDRHISHQRSMAIGLFVIGAALLMIMSALNPVISAAWVYVAWLLAGFGMGLMFNAAATAAMLATEEGKEGATASATGMAESLGIALASGLGGGIKNQMEYSGATLNEALLLIWLLMGAVLLFSFWVVLKRFPSLKAWYS